MLGRVDPSPRAPGTKYAGFAFCSRKGFVKQMSIALMARCLSHRFALLGTIEVRFGNRNGTPTTWRPFGSLQSNL